MSTLFLPQSYQPLLSVKETEQAIMRIKEYFQTALSTELNLTRVTAPLFVPKGTGLNDDLNGVERPVSFPVKDMGEAEMEIVHSLAKWKRVRVTELGLKSGFGIYTDMNAIRADEELDNVHSLYVDQWDWELAMHGSDRNLDFLKKLAEKVYACLQRAEFFVYDNYAAFEPVLPESLTFIHAEELWEMYPDLPPKMREDRITEKYGAVFVIGIGARLGDGKAHDGRAPDYDDWITENGRTSETSGHFHGLNGDLLVWNSVLGRALEISSMGIRVDRQALQRQLEYRGCPERAGLYFHRKLLAGELTQTAGGGIGQSRLCMFLLRKAHIGETQSSVWPDGAREACRKAGIPLL